MKLASKSLKLFMALGLALFALPALTPAQHYQQTNLVSDLSGTASTTDGNLVNPWGLTRSNTSPWWVGNNGTGTSTLYDGNGNPFPPPPNGPLVVNVPPPKDSPAGTLSTPTGIVFNGSPTDFLVGPNQPAVFIFVTEDGTISGWNPGANLQPGETISHNAVLKVDNSDGGSPDGAVYKGATIAERKGQRLLYVTNFRKGRVEVYDTNFQPVHFGRDAFDDDSLPPDFAPFNIQNVGGNLFVTYAQQDGQRHDDVAGPGNGFVVIFSQSGRRLAHLEHGDWFNSPWGVALAPADFGEFSHSLLIGNFGSGQIAAFNPVTFRFRGFLKNPDDSIVTIDGLWALAFGNGGTAGPYNSLFFTAGIEDEHHGLFGTLTAVAAEQDGDEE